MLSGLSVTLPNLILAAIIMNGFTRAICTCTRDKSLVHDSYAIYACNINCIGSICISFSAFMRCHAITGIPTKSGFSALNDRAPLESGWRSLSP